MKFENIICDLKFRFHWAPHVLSGNPAPESNRIILFTLLAHP